MTSTAGSPTPSGKRVDPRRGRDARHARADRRRGSRGCRRSRRSTASSCCISADEAEKHGVDASGDACVGRPRGRARRRRHRAARAHALPRDGRPGHRRELRPRRVPQLDGAARPRGGARARLRRRVRRRRAADARARASGRTYGRRERRRRLERVARAHDRARARGRRRGARAPAVRRDHLLDAVRLDRVQPLERRAGAHVGARGDRAHVRRGALAARATARDPARAPT